MNIENNKNFKLVKAIKKTNNQILKQESELVRKYDLTSSQYGVLEGLYLKGDMHINDLIKNQISTSGTMTVIIRNLEKLQYVTKKIDLEDKRFFKVALTKQGQDVVNNILPDRINQLDDFVNTLTEEEQDTLLNILYKFKKRYKVKNSE